MAFTPETAYHNLFDPAKKYFEIRALAGYVEQSREDNEIQSILKDIVKRLGDTVWKQGELVSGGGYTRGSSGAAINQLLFNEARVYIDGIVHTVDSKDVAITGLGTEEVGIRLVETLVTSSDDVTLRDPAVGFANYGQPGANRLKLEAVWALKSTVPSTDKFYPAYKFESGVEFVQPRVGEIDVVTQQLARRTFDESGNYVVGGFDISVESKGPEQVNIKVGNKDAIGNSKAYVQGYEIIKLADERKTVSRALGVSEVLDEAKLFELDTLLQAENPPESKLKGGSLTLDIQPAARIKRVTARFEAIQEVNSHLLDGSDEIIRGTGESSIQVIKVFSGPAPDPGNSGPEYVAYVNATNAAGTGDYFVALNAVNWAVTSSTGVTEPSSYYIYYTFIKELIVGEDCELNADGSLDLSRLTLKNTSGDGWILLAGRKVAVFPFGFNRATNLPQSSEIDVDYDYYLPRYDVVYLDESGEIKIETGEYADKPFIPFVSASKLALGHVYYPPAADYDQIQVTQYNVRRLTMSELRKLYDRLERAEFNQGILDLNAEASRRVGNEITSLSGILTEAFAYTVDEIENPVVNGVNRIKFNKLKTSPKIFSAVYREMSLPQKDRIIPVEWGAAVLDNLAYSSNSLGLSVIPSTNRPRIRALNATETLQVNQFDFPRQQAVLTLGTTELPSDSNEHIISVAGFNSDTALTFLGQTNISRDESISRISAGASILESRNYGTFINQQWVWCKGSGFKGNEVVDLRVGSQVAELTTSTTVAGSPQDSLKPFPIAPSVSGGFLGVVGQSGDGAGIYSEGSRILTNSNGEFLVAFKTPAGLASGKTIVQAEGETKTVAAAIISGNAMITFVDTSDVLISTLTAAQPLLFDPTLIPVRLVENNAVRFYTGDAPSTTDRDKILPETRVSSLTALSLNPPNLTEDNLHVYALVEWRVDAGQPRNFTISHTPLVSGGLATSRVFISPDNEETRDWFGTRKAVLYVGQVNQAFEYQVTLNNDSNNPSSVRGVVRKSNGIPTTALSSVASSVTISNTPVTTGNSSVTFSVTNASSYDTLSYTYGSIYKSGIAITSGNASILEKAPPSGEVPIYIELRNSSTGRAELVSRTIRVPTPRRDPIAQTFRVTADDTSNKGMFVRGARVFFSQVPSASSPNNFIYAYITPVVNGYPAPYESHIVMSKALTPADFADKTSANATVGVDFEFLNIAYLEPNRSYALVIFTPNKDYKVFVSKIGGQLLRNDSGAVSTPQTMLTQSVADGVLFEGATKETWIPKPEYDLTFELLDIPAFEKTGSVTFDINASSAADVDTATMVGFHLDAKQFVPFTSPGALNNDYSILWEYKLSSTGWRSFQPQNYVFVGQTTPTITVKATYISKDGLLTPVLQPANITATGVFRDSSGVYESNVATYSQAYTKVRMIGKMSIPAGTTVSWAISDNTSIDVSSVPTWAATTSYVEGDIIEHSTLYYRAKVSITGNESNPDPSVEVTKWEKIEVESFGRVWRTIIPVITTAANSQGFREYEQSLELPADSNRKQFMFKIQCTAVSSALTTPPRIRDIITIVNT